MADLLANKKSDKSHRDSQINVFGPLFLSVLVLCFIVFFSFFVLLYFFHISFVAYSCISPIFGKNNICGTWYPLWCLSYQWSGAPYHGPHAHIVVF